MTLASFRVRLAVALGLPLVPACKSSPPPEPLTPTGIGMTATSLPDARGKCAADQVHEHLCGLVEADNTENKAEAPPPYNRCPSSAVALDVLEENGIIDGWLLSSHDRSLTGFRYDHARSTAYVVNNGNRESEPRCCYERCAPIPAIAVPRRHLPTGMKEYEECYPKPESTSHPAAAAHQCPAAMHVRLRYTNGPADPLDDAPFVRASEESCCYSVASFHRCPPNTFETKDGGCEEPNPGGRPLREAGEIVIAPTLPREGWCTPASTISELTPAARAYAAGAWSREAAYEHASVAAFARLSIELMVHAAPAELVDAAHAAARDEIRHAQLCYGLATAFGGGVAIGPGSLALATSSQVPTLEQLAVDCFRDGCVNETVAALSAEEGLRRGEPAAVRSVLATITEDEARHAELSYRILAWALSRGDVTLRARIAEELDLLRAELQHATRADEPHADHDERCGIVHPRTAASVRRHVLAEIVIPCTEALLARPACPTERTSVADAVALADQQM